MKTRISLAVLVSLLIVAIDRPTMAQEFKITGNGDGLFRRSYQLGAHETLQLSTSGCSGATDSVIAIMRGNISFHGQHQTAAFNDDYNGGFCSFAAFTNTASSAIDVEAIIFSYNSGSPVFVSLATFRTSVGHSTSETILIGGINKQFSSTGGAYLTETYPVPVAAGGVPGGDTVLYVINPASEANSYEDDDLGLSRLSAVYSSVLCQTCWLVAGGYFPTVSVGNISAVMMSGADADSDGISDVIESLMGTSPTNWDTDGDGISDRAEIVGITVDGAIGGDASIMLPWEDTGSNPVVPDIFVQVNFMSAGGHSHDPRAAGNWTNAANDLTQIFTNDNAFTGKTIRTHYQFFTTTALPETTNIGFDNSCVGLASYTGFYSIKNNPTWFNSGRAVAYHFVIYGHRLAIACQDKGSSGQAEVLGDDLMVTLGGFSAGVGTPTDQLGTTIHELGHDLSLTHNGNDNPTDSLRSCIHSSPMNYKYQLGGWGNGAVPAFRRYSYSRGVCDASGLSCGNTCVNRCVPAGQGSPKTGCSSNNGACDCDVTEWTNIQLRFPFNNDSGPRGEGEEQTVKEYLLSDTRRFRQAHRDLASRRREFAEAKGLREGYDFRIDPESGRMYSVE